jgi:hypothetical protein
MEYLNMKKMNFSQLALRLVAVFAVVGLVAGGSSLSEAADHTDPPDEFGGLSAPTPQPADINDLYAWHTDTSIIAVVTFNGLKGSGTISGGYAADVVYGLHFDNDADASADHDVWIRFGQNDADEWGIQVQGLPSESQPLAGPVGQSLSGDAATVQAGVFDDPFFFDIAGFNGTISNGSLTDETTGGLYFTQTDSLAGTNTNAVVIEIPRDGVLGGTDTVQVWTTSSRMNGGN